MDRQRFTAFSAFGFVIALMLALMFFPPARAADSMLPDLTVTVSVPVTEVVTEILPPVTVNNTVTVPGPELIATETVTLPQVTVTEPGRDTIVTEGTTITQESTITVTASATLTAEATTDPYVSTVTATASIQGETVEVETEVTRRVTARDVAISTASLVVGAVGVLALLYLTRRYTKLREQGKFNRILRNLKKETTILKK